MVTCTPAAAAHIRAELAKRGEGLGLRIGINTSGCSGLAYILEFCDAPNECDTLFPTQDVVLVVDNVAQPYLEGATLDYVSKGLNSGFEFINPNERDRCGCGKSFRV